MYPINMRLEGRSAAIVGGGRVALRKVRRLLESGAQVTVMTKEVLPELAELAAAGKIHLLAELCSQGKADVAGPGNMDFAGYTLVFAATDDFALNHAICLQAKSAGALVNSATAPEDCDFFLPALVKRGDVELTVGTGGDSPALARLIRQDMEARYHEDFAVFAAWLREMRQDLMSVQADTAVRQELWHKAMDKAVFDLILQHRLEQAKDEIRRKISGTGTESQDCPGRNPGEVQYPTGKDNRGAVKP